MKTTIQGLQAIEPWEWPDNASAMILQTLTNKTLGLDERKLAVGLAGETVVLNDSMAEALLEVLAGDDEPVELRASAATSVGVAIADIEMEGGYDDLFDLDDEYCISKPLYDRVQATCRALWHDQTAPELVRRRALEASARGAQDWHHDAIRSAYNSGNDNMRLTAVFCMTSVSGFEAEILQALESDELWTRLHAVQAAANWEIKKAWKFVREILDAGNPGGASNEPEKALFLTAIEAIPGLLSKSKAQDLLAEFMESDDEEVAATAEEAGIYMEPDDFDFNDW